MEYRFSENVFRRFEAALKKAVDRTPDVTVFNPHPYTVTTFSRRLRDAKKSLLENGWKTNIDVAKLREYDLVIAERADVVLTGSASSISSYDRQGSQTFATNYPTDLAALRHLRLSKTERNLVEAAIILHQYGEVDSLELPPDTEIEPLADLYDLVYEKFPDKILII